MQVRRLALAMVSACTAPTGDGSYDTDVVPTDSEVTVAPCDVPGAICTLAGRPGQLGYDGDGNDALATMLYYPSALAWSPEGRLVVDDFNNMRIRELGADGHLRTIVGSGEHGWGTPGPATTSPLENPVDVAFLPDGTLAIAELHTSRVLGVEAATLSVLVGTGDEGLLGDGGDALAAQLNNPSGIDVDAATGAIYIADTDNHCIRVVQDGLIQRVGGDGTPGVEDDMGGARFNHPQHVFVDGPRSRLLVADAGNHLVRAIDLHSYAVTTIAGTGELGSDGDEGPATAAQLRQPYGVAVDAEGRVLIADLGANNLRRVDLDGTIHTIAGTGDPGFAGDEGPAVDAQLYRPADVLVGPDDALYVADMFNGVVRRIAP